MSAGDASKSFWDPQVQAVLNSSLDSVIAINPAGVVTDWNVQAEKTFGWTRNEAIGRKLEELIVPTAYQEAFLKGLHRFGETGEAPIVGERLELSAIRRDGSEFPIELSVTRVVKDDEIYFVAYLRDITDWTTQEKLQSLEMLEAKLVGDTAVTLAQASSFEESLQNILDTICQEIDWPVGHVWIPNESGSFLVSSHIWHVAPDMQIDELHRATANATFGPDHGLSAAIWRAAEPIWLESIDKGHEFVRADACRPAGLRSWFGFPVSSHDQVEAVLEFFHSEPQPRDSQLIDLVVRLGRRIGDLVHSRRFEHQQAKLAAIVDSSYDAIIGKDLNGVITSWNAGAERIYGYTEEQAIGSPISIILPDDLEREEPEILHAIETGERLEQFQTTRRRQDGTLIPVSLTVSPIIDSSQRVVGASSIERDISSRRRREKELQDARESALKANRTRGEFLANVSHELRTPMNAIIGMTEIALDEPLTPDVRDYIQTANEAAHSLLTLLDDILDFSKLESGKFTITNELFSLSDVIDDTIRTISSQAFAKGLELVCEIPSELPRRVIGDPMRIRQILTNLLSNAIKFTEQGEVVLQAQVVRTWPTEVRVRFSVIDTGIGIPQDQQRRILEPFAQVDSSTTREHGGTGLGLAICSELLRVMGGKLSLTSQTGKGSTFSFRLSFDLPSDPIQVGAQGVPLEKLKDLPVLVVDDNETNRRILSEALKNWSMKPALAKDADQAVGIYRQAEASGQPFPLVIVDALMPGTDGYDLSQKLATTAPQDDKSPVILMVSSTDRRQFREREDEADVSVFLQKPVTQSDLLDAVMRALDVQPPELISEAIDSHQLGEPLVSHSVLLAEDTPANQKVVTTVLKKRGHSVTVANNGREAVELFKQEHFDVVLMDVQMPILDGFQATAAIREHERDQDSPTPIIAMTAHAMRGDREKCLEAGMDAYIAKPVDVKQLLGLIESVAEERANGKAMIMSDETDKTYDEEGGAPIIDYPAAMQRLGDDEELFREFVGFYDEDASRLIDDVEKAVHSSDAAKLQHAAHSLKGLASNLAASRLVEAAFLLEDAGRTGQLGDSPQKLARLKAAYVSLDRALDKYRS